MPLMPPGNALFRAYVDGNGKLQSQYIGREPIGCASCGRETYETASGRCAWCGEAVHIAPYAVGA